MSPEVQTQIADAKKCRHKCRCCSLNLTVDPGGMLEYESTVTYWLGSLVVNSLVVKCCSRDQVVPGSNPGPVISKRGILGPPIKSRPGISLSAATCFASMVVVVQGFGW